MASATQIRWRRGDHRRAGHRGRRGRGRGPRSSTQG